MDDKWTVYTHRSRYGELEGEMVAKGQAGVGMPPAPGDGRGE
eukprot:SAG11_NODE_44_length_20765_cov_5.183635_27_plen_42_part_00